jgi:hypothetical protein
MAKPSVESGAVIDGFTVGECVHRGGMATLWERDPPNKKLNRHFPVLEGLGGPLLQSQSID